MKRMRHVKVLLRASMQQCASLREEATGEQVRERERERERGEEKRGRDSFLHFNTDGVGGRRAWSFRKAAVVHTLCSFPPPGTVRARQAALFGDSPRGKFLEHKVWSRSINVFIYFFR